ncbi:hypothetical protein SVIO_055270 [Streptomyces violaceusniger]|uniref:Response regulatory domain-containing protein n=1 Tax=Streptomyces violaceusniger TaxID=68280 RepID=A0A4D4L3E3_STRVO|nr:hypothetical protein SVIO_055270 [Streptomyces violaceusniger]
MPTSPHGRTELLRPDGSPVRVLVVDDESALADLLSMALRYEGWEVRTAGDGAEAIRTTRELRPDAVVLDIMLPDMDGLTVLGRLRRELPDVPVLFLTARDAVEDRIAGLTAGGDDYVTKPFSLEEVVARLRGLLRRSGAAAARSESVLAVGDLILDEDSHEVSRGDRRSTSPRPSSSCCAISCAIRAGCSARRRSSTGSGAMTSAARPTWSSSTSRICGARSTRGAAR